jgi:acetylornithine deacetylase/succinyl-diaminopimelate desuccinylase-like protein
MKNQKAHVSKINPKTIMEEVAQLAKIPSPPLMELEKMKYLYKKVGAMNVLNKLHIDKENNLSGFIQGSGRKTLLFVSHVDAESGFTSPVKQIANKLYGQGVFNNSYANIALVNLLGHIKADGTQPEATSYFLWSSGSHGSGSSHGMKYFLNHHPEIDGIINLDALNLGELCVECPGLYKASIEFTSPQHERIFAQMRSMFALLEVAMKYRANFDLQEVEDAAGQAIIQVTSTHPLDYGRACHEVHKYIHRVVHTHNLVVHIKTIHNSPPSQMSRENPLLRIIQNMYEKRHISTRYLSYNSDADLGLFENIPTVSMGLARGSRPLTQPEYLMIPSLAEGFTHLSDLFWALQSSGAIG